MAKRVILPVLIPNLGEIPKTNSSLGNFCGKNWVKYEGTYELKRNILNTVYWISSTI